jgi:hypothetical protein
MVTVAQGSDLSASSSRPPTCSQTSRDSIWISTNKELIHIFLFVCLIGFYVTLTQYRSYGDVPALLVRKTSHERIQSPCQDSTHSSEGQNYIYIMYKCTLELYNQSCTEQQICQENCLRFQHLVLIITDSCTRFAAAFFVRRPSILKF